MKKLRIVTLSVITMVLSAGVFFSCNKEDVNLNETSLQVEKSANNVTTDRKGINNGTGKVDPVLFGKLHNEYLIKAIENKKNNPDLTNKEALMMVEIPGLNNEEKSNIIDLFSATSYEDMKKETLNNLKNPKAIKYYNQIEEVLENIENYNTFQLELSIIRNKINQDLTGTDWDALMVFIETINSSAYLWLPEDKGGNGIGYNFAQTSPNHLGRRLPKWVSADGRGAGYGMVSWALTGGAALGPHGAVGGFVAGAVLGAVFSSLDAHAN